MDRYLIDHARTFAEIIGFNYSVNPLTDPGKLHQYWADGTMPAPHNGYSLLFVGQIINIDYASRIDCPRVTVHIIGDQKEWEFDILLLDSDPHHPLPCLRASGKYNQAPR